MQLVFDPYKVDLENNLNKIQIWTFIILILVLLKVLLRCVLYKREENAIQKLKSFGVVFEKQ